MEFTIKTVTGVLGRTVYQCEIEPGFLIEASTKEELLKRIQWHYEQLEEEHGQTTSKQE
jgi:predicted small metal-binding protein